jgi:hypothetical protein
LIVYPIGLIGGLEDSKAKPEPSDFVRLENWTTFRGRFALRAPVFLTTTLTASDANATRALGGAFHDGKMWLAVFRDTNDDVRLWELTTAGVFTADRGALWTGITGAVPRPVFAPFEGGSAVGGTKRLYVADYDEQQVTKFWDGSSIASLQVDFDNSGSAEDVKYHYVFPYQFHLWGAGFFQGTTGRKEMLRFSQPGLIPSDDPDTTAGTLVEWFAADFRPVGRRGDKITNIGVSGGPMIVFKDRQTFALFGYDSQSWAIRQLSERVGAVGPYASASTGDGLCFFWTDRGPHVTDGQTVTDISDKVVVGFSSDDGVVYFIYPRGGSTEPDRWLGFDKERGTWTEGEGFAVGGGLLQVKHAILVPSVTLPGPVASPSSLALTVLDENSISVTWVNGDTALDTATLVNIATSAGGSPVQVAGLASGVTAVGFFGLTPKTTYFVRAYHKRNTIVSGFSNEASAKTKLQRPSALDAFSISTGNRVSLFNNESGADIAIESRKATFTVSGSGTVSPPDRSFTLITTLAAQSTGTKTYDDTAALSGATYEYRARVIKAGETTSEYSNTDLSVAARPSSVPLAFHNVYTTTCYSADVLWQYSVGKPEDVLRISRSIDGGAYVQLAVVSLSTGFWNDSTIGWKTGATARTLQYKLEVLDNGTTVVDTDITTLSNHNVDPCP